jgi:PKD-like domain
MQSRLVPAVLVLTIAVFAAPLQAACTPPAPVITMGQDHVCQASTGTASITPDPDPSAVYLWTVNTAYGGEIVSGGASPTVTFEAYGYIGLSLNVRVSNSCGMTTASHPVTIVLFPNTELPLNLFSMPGQPVTITTTEHAGIPDSYQWYRGMRGDTSQPIGTSSSSVTVTTPAADSYYWVHSTNECTSMNSNEVHLHACNYPVPQPVINTQGFSCSGDIFTVSTAADPDPAATYEWRYLPSLACDHYPTPEVGPNGTTASVRLRSGVAFCGAQLILTITNSCYSATTQAHVTEDQPVNFDIVAPAAVRMGETAMATTEGPVFQDWHRPIFQSPGSQPSDTTIHWTISGGVIVDGQDSRTVSFISNSTFMTLTAAVANSCGAANRSTTISSCQNPTISMQPASGQITAGSTVTLTASTVGIAPLAYEWYSVGAGNVLTPVGGNTAAVTLAPSVTTTYIVRTQTRCGPNLDSAPVTVTVTAAPCEALVITDQPADQAIIAGTTVRLRVDVEGTLPASFQWYSGNRGDTTHPVPGAIFATLAMTPAQPGLYWARITNRCASADTRAAAVTLVTPRRRASRH